MIFFNFIHDIKSIFETNKGDLIRHCMDLQILLQVDETKVIYGKNYTRN
jgi:hypothetical protein